MEAASPSSTLVEGIFFRGSERTRSSVQISEANRHEVRMGSVIKKRRKRMAKKKHRKLLRKTRHQRRNKK
jgi:hypothetical protein